MLDGNLKKKIHSKAIFKLQALELFHQNFIDAIEYNVYGLRADPEIYKWIKLTKMDSVSASFVVSNLGKIDWVNENHIYKEVFGPYMVADVTYSVRV